MKTQIMSKESDFQKLEAKANELLEKVNTVVETPALHDKELLKVSLKSVENLIEAFEAKLGES